MSDTENMHREFEVWADTLDLDVIRFNVGYSDCNTDYAWSAWQAATERATAIERERCAVVCEAMKTVCGTEDVERGWNGSLRRSASAIRQGGAT